MESAPLGTTRLLTLHGRRKRMTIWIEQDDGTILKTVAIQSVVYRQKFLKVSYHGPYRQRWRRYSEHVWIQATGSRIPPGYRLFHRDGNPLNDSLDNLLLCRGQPFSLLCTTRPDVAKRREHAQRKAVRRSNKLRHQELKAAKAAQLDQDAFYIVPDNQLVIVWKPFRSEPAAQKAASQQLNEWLKRDGLPAAQSIHIFSGQEISKLTGPDRPLEAHRRFIPDERAARKKRGVSSSSGHFFPSTPSE